MFQEATQSTETRNQTCGDSELQSGLEFFSEQDKTLKDHRSRLSNPAFLDVLAFMLRISLLHFLFQIFS